VIDTIFGIYTSEVMINLKDFFVSMGLNSIEVMEHIMVLHVV